MINNTSFFGLWSFVKNGFDAFDKREIKEEQQQFYFPLAHMDAILLPIFQMTPFEICNFFSHVWHVEKILSFSAAAVCF